MKPIERRIVRVCQYVEQNLDKTLTLAQLSQVAAFSRYHFHRLFSAYTGVSLGRFVTLLKLRRASFRLAFESDKRVIDIALEAGFDSPEAFSRAFKRHFGQTPRHFRDSPEWPQWHSKYQFARPTSERQPMHISIVDFTETPVALIEHHGSPEIVLKTAGKFIAWRQETGLSPINSSRTFGVAHHDPSTVRPEEFRFDICGSIEGKVPENRFGVRAGVIPGGRCAVVRHRGSHDDMDGSIYYLYRDWLPESGEKLRDFPCFFQYLNFVHEVDECDLLTDIFLPIQ